MTERSVSNESSEFLKPLMGHVLGSSMPDSVKVQVTKALMAYQKKLDDMGFLTHIAGNLLSKQGGQVHLTRADVEEYSKIVTTKKSFPIISYVDVEGGADVTLVWNK